MENLNLTAAWIGILGGIATGAGMGLLFYKEDWLGGYSTWRRRLVRLAHISFFGLGLINLAYALTISQLELSISVLPGQLLVLAAISMPVVCYLAAWRQPMRHLFPVPVISLAAGLILFMTEGGLL